LQLCWWSCSRVRSVHSGGIDRRPKRARHSPQWLELELELGSQAAPGSGRCRCGRRYRALPDVELKLVVGLGAEVKALFGVGIGVSLDGASRLASPAMVFQAKPTIESSVAARKGVFTSALSEQSLRWDPAAIATPFVASSGRANARVATLVGNEHPNPSDLGLRERVFDVSPNRVWDGKTSAAQAGRS
jgi:hypothetical protein